jgi:hypothetical protein
MTATAEALVPTLSSMIAAKHCWLYWRTGVLGARIKEIVIMATHYFIEPRPRTRGE